MKENAQHIFCVGAKSMGAYGGYETFVHVLTEYHQNNEKIQYHMAWKANGEGSKDESKIPGVIPVSENVFYLHNTRCFKIPVPKIGPAQAIYYDVMALKACCDYIRTNRIPHPIVYIMACRIGPAAWYFYRQIHKLGGKVYLNPDGHEWKRAKWSAPVRAYWKFSEGLMVKYSDLVICDSINIEQYIQESYRGKGIGGSDPTTTYIPYGAEIRAEEQPNMSPELGRWYQEKGLRAGGYYLVVGRLVPENNYETMIREFMKSKTDRDFVLITNSSEKFLNAMKESLHFEEDTRIKFVGSVYDRELLMQIRGNAYAYFHGHEVGGTNPSLLEALGATDLNLLLDVNFNREVAETAALYWTKEEGSLAGLIDQVDDLPAAYRAQLGEAARDCIRQRYNWTDVCRKYETVFCQQESAHEVVYG